MAQKAFKRCKIVIVWNQALFRKRSKKFRNQKKHIENRNKIKFIREFKAKAKKIKYPRKAFKDCKIVIVWNQAPIRK